MRNSNDYHYYFKVTIGFQCLTYVQYAMGSKGLVGHAGGCADPEGGGGGAGGLDPSENHTLYG